MLDVVLFRSLEIPLITWHKNDIELDPIRDPKYSYPNGSSSHHKLVINDVGIKDSDWYSCIAMTRSAVITSPQAQLIVNHKPGMTNEYLWPGSGAEPMRVNQIMTNSMRISRSYS